MDDFPYWEKLRDPGAGSQQILPEVIQQSITRKRWGNMLCDEENSHWKVLKEGQQIWQRVWSTSFIRSR